MYDVMLNYTSEYLCGLPTDDLRQLGGQARQARLELETAKAQAFGHADKPHLFRKVRRDIARIETEIRRRYCAILKRESHDSAYRNR